MRVAVVQFPGSNCDQDALHSLRDQIGVQADYVWHDHDDLAGFDAVFIPGGSSYGDYFRWGPVAARAPLRPPLHAVASEGRPLRDAAWLAVAVHRAPPLVKWGESGGAYSALTFLSWAFWSAAQEGYSREVSASVLTVGRLV